MVKRKMSAEMKKAAVKLAKKAGISLYHSFGRLLPVRNNLIVFDSNSGGGYAGNPRAVYERMVELGLDKTYECVWFFRNMNDGAKVPGNAKKISFNSPLFLYYMSIAKVWLFDARNPDFLRKKDGQIYIQTWHGTPLKKIGLDMDHVVYANYGSKEEYFKVFRRNLELWDYLIVQNKFSEKTFERCFDFHKTMLRTGYPRNDLLFKKHDTDAIRRKLGIPPGKKVLLYVPTYRDDEYDEDRKYTFSPDIDFNLMKEKLENEYVLAVKYHYFVNSSSLPEKNSFIYPFRSNTDINELYLIADAMITDYSSVMFDYGLLNRPMYFYCYDLEKYKSQLHEFYFDFVNESPGPISKNTQELIDHIIHEKEILKKYEERIRCFKEEYHTYEKGTACDSLIIEKIVNDR